MKPLPELFAVQGVYDRWFAISPSGRPHELTILIEQNCALSSSMRRSVRNNLSSGMTASAAAPAPAGGAVVRGVLARATIPRGPGPLSRSRGALNLADSLFHPSMLRAATLRYHRGGLSLLLGPGGRARQQLDAAEVRKRGLCRWWWRCWRLTAATTWKHW